MNEHVPMRYLRVSSAPKLWKLTFGWLLASPLVGCLLAIPLPEEQLPHAIGALVLLAVAAGLAWVDGLPQRPDHHEPMIPRGYRFSMISLLGAGWCALVALSAGLGALFWLVFVALSTFVALRLYPNADMTARWLRHAPEKL